MLCGCVCVFVYLFVFLWRVQETSKALEVGASVLLPPVHERLDMLLAILPEDPSSIVGLTTGQVHILGIGVPSIF